jgi:hypothetical protein
VSGFSGNNIVDWVIIIALALVVFSFAREVLKLKSVEFGYVSGDISAAMDHVEHVLIPISQGHSQRVPVGTDDGPNQRRSKQLSEHSEGIFGGLATADNFLFLIRARDALLTYRDNHIRNTEDSASRPKILELDLNFGLENMDRPVGELTRRAYHSDLVYQHVGALGVMNSVALMLELNIGDPASEDRDTSEEPVRPDWRLLAFNPIAFAFAGGALYLGYLVAQRSDFFGQRFDLLFLFLVACFAGALAVIAGVAWWLRLGLG